MLFSGDDIRESARNLLKSLFRMPEMVFFIRNNREITELFAVMSNQELQTDMQTEAVMFERLLSMAGIDTEKVKPGIVHNYIHAIYLTTGSDLMVMDDLAETYDQMMNSLLAYIFGGM